LNHLNHLNIAKFYEYDREIVVKYPNGEYENSVAIILEFCDGGDLFQFVLGTGRLSENIARSFFIQIWQALLHMQENGISHRDLKWENIMLDSQFNIKIIDYGFAAVNNKSETYRGKLLRIYQTLN
jgi:serine/threonine protein kinase